MENPLRVFASLDFFDSPTMMHGDVLPDPNVTEVFTITAEFADGIKKQRRGNFNRLELPPDYQEFIQLIEYLKDYGHSEMLSYRKANRMPRRKSDLMFCRMSFHPGERTYSYLCEIPTIQCGTWVLVPVGKENRLAVGCVERIEYRQPDNAPFPLDRIKKLVANVPSKPYKIWKITLQRKTKQKMLPFCNLGCAHCSAANCIDAVAADAWMCSPI